MSQRKLLAKIKSKLNDANDKLNAAADELVLTDKEKELRDSSMLCIKSGQYLLLVLGIILIIRSDYKSGIGTLLATLFFERIAAQTNKAIGNKSMSRHIAANYSGLTKLTNIFKPIADAINHDARNIDNRFKRLT